MTAAAPAPPEHELTAIKHARVICQKDQERHKQKKMEWDTLIPLLACGAAKSLFAAPCQDIQKVWILFRDPRRSSRFAAALNYIHDGLVQAIVEALESHVCDFRVLKERFKED